MATASTPTAPARIARESRPKVGGHDRSVSRRLLELITTRRHLGPPDRRWELANAIVARAAPPRCFRGQIDSVTRLAVRYLKLRTRKRLGADRWLAHLDQAFHLRFHADKLTRATLEARLLTGEPIEDTAAKCRLPLKVVSLYESVFFAVQGRLQHREFIINHAVGPRYRSGYTEDDVDIILKSMAFLKGPMFLDYVLPFFTTAWEIPDRLDRLTIEQLDRLRYMASIKAMIAAMTMPAEKAAPAYERLLAGLPAVQWESLASELKEVIAVETGVKTVVSNSLSSATMQRMIDSFAVTQTAAEPGNEVEKPVAMAG